jgi:transcriptional regulator with XRE-family HTH domain
MVYLDLFKQACAEVGKSPSGVLNELNISKSVLAGWRNGQEPTNRTKKLIADYFGVTVSEFMAGKAVKKEPATEGGLNGVDKEIVENFRRLTEDHE